MIGFERVVLVRYVVVLCWNGCSDELDNLGDRVNGCVGEGEMG